MDNIKAKTLGSWFYTSITAEKKCAQVYSDTRVIYGMMYSDNDHQHGVDNICP